MGIQSVISSVAKFAHNNAPTLLSSTAIVGVGTTVYLTARGAYKSALEISLDESVEGTAADPKTRFKSRAALTWKNYIPAGIACTATVALIVTSTRVSNQRAATMMGLYSLSEKAFTEYKEKVLETQGEKVEQKIRDSIAEDRMKNDPVSNTSEVYIAGTGTQLCYESFTGRYFQSDIETLRQAENRINFELRNSMYASLNDLYREIGLPVTSNGEEVGWNADTLLQLQFSSMLADDNRPCIVVGYNVHPKTEYYKFV